MFANIFQPLIDVAEWILRFFHDSLNFSWGWAIVGLTVVVRMAILPLTFKQVRSMQAMQRLQPEMKELQKRYKDDKQRMNQELMKLYQDHQVNPLGSCLPLVLQLPFFLSLFYLQQSEGFRALVRGTGSALGSLAGHDPVAATQVVGGEKFLFISDITQPATGAVLITLVVIYVLTQLGSSTVSAMAMTDKNQKRLMFALPFLFVPFILGFPAGLIVYWITTNTWTIGQQLLIRKVLPPPHLKDAEVVAGDGDAEPKRGGGLRGMLTAVTEAAGLDKSDDDAGTPKRPPSTPKKQRGGGAKATDGAGSKGRAGGRSAGDARPAKAAKKAPAEGGNGRPEKAPPPSPRKKKKRSGRRR
jgi:YidC/Oxa1 family membrane protein insertase